MLFSRAASRTNPVFYPDRLESRLSHDPARRDRIATQRHNVDLLVWNVVTSLDSDRDRDYLARQLQPLGGAGLRAPVSLSLWTGVHREPTLRPSAAYQRWLRATFDGDASGFLAPIEVPISIESPGRLVLVDATLDSRPRGSGGRDRLVELIDAGAEQARALNTSLVVACLYRSGSATAQALSRRIDELRGEAALAQALPWHDEPPSVELRELSWQRLLEIWDHSRDGLRLSRQPVKRFLAHCAELGLR